MSENIYIFHVSCVAKSQPRPWRKAP